MHEIKNPDEDDLSIQNRFLSAWQLRFNEGATYHRLRPDGIRGIQSPVQNDLHEDRAGQAGGR